MNATNRLRWRARVAQEAFQNDTSNDQSNDNLMNVSTSTTASTSSTSFQQQHRVSTLVIDTAALLAMGASLYVAFFVSTPATSTTLLRMTSTALTFGMAILVLFQERKKRQLRSLLRVHQVTTRTVRSLQQLHEQSYRHITALQRSADRMSALEEELGSSTTSISHLVNVVQDVTRIQQHQLKQQWFYHNQEQIMNAILLKDYNNQQRDSYTMSPSEANRLIQQLQNMPGLLLQQDNARDLLNVQQQQQQQQHGSTSSSLENVLKLVRQLRHDVNQPPDNHQKKNGMWLDDDDNNNTVVFRFQPRQLLSSHQQQDLMEF